MKNKELTSLEALERIKEFYPTWRLSNREDFNLIESNLKNYEQLKINYSELQDVNAFYTCECKDKLKALEIIKKAFNSSSTYKNKLKDSLECGWITQEEYDLLKEVLK